MSIPITKKQKKLLCEEGECRGMTCIDEQFFGMDSHGCNISIIVVKIKDDDALYAFTYRQSSEECFYEDDPMELVKVVARPVEKIEYERADGDDWSEHV